jgi:hypothetical protein
MEGIMDVILKPMKELTRAGRFVECKLRRGTEADK